MFWLSISMFHDFHGSPVKQTPSLPPKNHLLPSLAGRPPPHPTWWGLENLDDEDDHHLSFPLKHHQKLLFLVDAHHSTPQIYRLMGHRSYQGWRKKSNNMTMLPSPAKRGLGALGAFGEQCMIIVSESGDWRGTTRVFCLGVKAPGMPIYLDLHPGNWL